MTRTGQPETGHAPTHGHEGLGGDPMRHAPKPANVGLGSDGRAAGTREAGTHEERPYGERLHGRTEADFRHERRFDVDEEEHRARVAADQRSIADLIKELRDEATHLLRQEVNLAKTELSEKASFFGTQAGKIAAGGAVAGVGALLLLSALAWGIGWLLQWGFLWTTTSSVALGYLIVGLIVAIVGYSMYASAKRKMQREPIAPERTLNSLKEDKQWLTNKTQDVTR
jgi:hypothetical protein